MNYEEIDKNEWKVFFDSLSKLLYKKEDVDLRFISPSVGNQVIETSTPFMGVTYDPNDDELNLFFKSLGHTIQNPSRIVLGEMDRSLVSISIEDSDNQIHTIEFSRPIWMDFELLKGHEQYINHDQRQPESTM